MLTAPALSLSLALCLCPRIPAPPEVIVPAGPAPRVGGFGWVEITRVTRVTKPAEDGEDVWTCYHVRDWTGRRPDRWDIETLLPGPEAGCFRFRTRADEVCGMWLIWTQDVRRDLGGTGE